MAGRRPWAQLERLLERLPRHSHYRAELDDADDYAALVDAGETPQQAPSVPLVNYDHLAMRLDNIFDAVNAVADILVAVNSKKNSQRGGTRAPRPETAIQRKRKRQRADVRDDIEQQMTGGR